MARVAELAAKVEEARGLRRAASFDLLLKVVSDKVISDPRWPRIPLGDISETQNGLAPRPKNEPPGTRVLRISAATSRQDGVVDELDHKFLDLSDEQIKKFALRPGDLLACRFNGNLHFVGRFAIFKGLSKEQYVYPDKLIRFRVDETRVKPDYVRIAMNSPVVRSAIEAKCATTAGNIGISAAGLKTIELPIPPLSEQQKIIAHLSTL